MNKNLEILANLLYREWLKTHDPYEDDFLTEVLEIHLPDIKFHMNTDITEIFIIN